jgi:hypothetical protein
MAYVGVTNQVANQTNGLAMYVLKESLKLAGWTVVTSGTGTAGTTGAGDLITTGTGTAIGSFARNGAWVRMREPSPGTREYVFQNGQADNSPNGIIKYSRATGFATGGTATVAPTTGGGDGIVFVGSGTDAAPVNTTWIPNAAGGYYHCVASDTANNGVWGWWWYGYTISPVANQVIIATESVATGSTPVQDQDPSIRYRDNIYNNQATVAWWEAYGLASPVYRTGGSFGLYFNIGGTLQFVTNFTGTDPYVAGQIVFYPAIVGLTTVRPKGFPSETVITGRVNAALDTFNLTSAQAKITLYGSVGARQFASPWVTNVVPLG